MNNVSLNEHTAVECYGTKKTIKNLDGRARLSLLFQLKEQIESNQSEFGAMQGVWMKTSTQLR